MSVLNKIFLEFSNKVMLSVTFGADSDFSSISDFSEVVLVIGDESYSTLSTPSSLYIDGDILTLDIGSTTELDPASYSIEIIGYDGSNKYMLNCAEYSCIPETIVKGC